MTGAHYLCGFGYQGIRSVVHDYVCLLVRLLDCMSIVYFGLVLLIDRLFESLYNA